MSMKNDKVRMFPLLLLVVVVVVAMTMDLPRRTVQLRLDSGSTGC